MDLRSILRNNSAFRLIKSDIEHNMLSHSYMMVGDDALVVDEFLTLVKMLVYCESHTAEDNCAECKKVLDGNNTNIYDVVPANGKDIKVEEISQMIEDTYIAPYEDKIKLYTIARGESMNPQAENKLLKTLEEPIGKKLILIGTTNESNMLDTIKSRCKKIYITPFAFNEILELFGKEAETADIERAYKLSGGRYSLIKAMLSSDNNLAEEYDNVVDMLIHLKSSRDLPAVVRMMDKKINKESVSDFLNILEVVLRDTLKGGNKNLHNFGYDGRTISNVQDLINKGREKLNFNCGAHAVLDYVLFGILEVKYKCQL